MHKQRYKKTISALFPAVLPALLLVLPVFLGAQFEQPIDIGKGWLPGVSGGLSDCSGGIIGVLCIINDIFSYVLPVLITLGLIYFLWGVSKYVAAGDDETGRTEGRQMMINGIIALFVMISVWGLVGLIVDTFNVTETSAPLTPQIVR